MPTPLKEKTPDLTMVDAAVDMGDDLESHVIDTWLAGAGGKDRASTHPWLPVALAAKVVADAAFATTGTPWCGTYF